jgi:ubiquinol-cytochrome c reductase cytochrome b subunit
MGVAMQPEKRVSLSSILPRLGLSALLGCIASGIVLTFHYRPMGNVFQNVEEITTLVPYGWFIRQFHYASGQMFVILMFIHTADHFLKRRYRAYPQKRWLLLVTSLGVCFFTLFTGFVLKGDQEGQFAGRIFMNIMKTIPVAGAPLSRLFVREGEGFFFLPYLYHCFFLPVLILYLLRGHIRAWFPDRGVNLAVTGGLCLFALAIPPGLPVPPDVPAAVVEGPWFFLGIQTLLRSVPVAVAGLLVPAFLGGTVMILPLFRGAVGKSLFLLTVLSWCAYGALILYAHVWGP